MTRSHSRALGHGQAIPPVSVVRNASAHGFASAAPGRMGLLRGCGNLIMLPLAAEFVTAFLESLRYSRAA